MVPDRDEHDREGRKPQDGPEQLRCGERVATRVDLGAAEIETVDHREPEAVQAEHQGQENWIGVRRHPAYDEVRGDSEPDQSGAQNQGAGRHSTLGPESDRAVRADADGHGQDRQEELGAASFPGDPG